MIGDLAGVLDRRGVPDAEALARALGPGARTVASGPLAVAFTGAAATDGASLAVLDGLLDVAPRTDAELLAAWRASGDTVLAGLRGDFALVLWDGRRGLLARDHMGGRGLYWHDDGAQLRFASEIVLLLALLPTRPAPDDVGVAHWLNIGAHPGDHTLYSGIRRLAAAHALPLDPAGPQPARAYWQPRYADPVRAPRGEWAARWRGALETAVARRSPDPDTTAVLLSGGLDSSSVAGLLPRPLRAYSAVFPEHPATDESALIAELCTTLELSPVRAEVRAGSPLAGAIAYTERWAVPSVSPNVYFWMPLFERAAADGIRVLLDGEGGDELFGLSAPLVADRLRARDPLGALALIYRAPGALGRPSLRSVRRWALRAGLAPLAPAWAHAASRRVHGPQHYVPAWMLPQTAQAFAVHADGGAYKRLDGPRWWASLVDMCVTGQGPALGYEHIRLRAATAGIAARHPIMDVDVIETVLATPPELSFDPFVTRPLLREAVAGRVPERIRLRTTKSTFDPVFHAGLTGPDLTAARTLLGAPDARVGAYVDRAAMRAALLDSEPPRDGERMLWAVQLWRLLTAECWLRLGEGGAGARQVHAVTLPATVVDLVAG